MRNLTLFKTFTYHHFTHVPGMFFIIHIFINGEFIGGIAISFHFFQRTFLPMLGLYITILGHIGLKWEGFIWHTHTC